MWTPKRNRVTHNRHEPVGAIEEARAFVRKHIPRGYAEFMNWGVINRGIPLEEFSET